jgi:hypothetical protein
MRWFAACLVLVLAACAAQGPATNTFVMRYQWLNYVEGNDIKSLCEPGAPARIRLIYNAVFTEEVRTYDLTAVDQGSTAMTTRRWTGSSAITLRNGSFTNSMAPQEGEAYIGPDDTRAIVAALDASGFYAPPPDGLTLRSDDFFWVGTACIDGEFMVQAYPKDRFGDIRFAGLLAGFDPIQAPLPEPRPLDLPPLNSVHGGPPQHSNNADSSALFYRVDVKDGLLVANWRT